MNEWGGVRFQGVVSPEVVRFRDVVSRAELDTSSLPNRATEADVEALRARVPDAITLGAGNEG